MTPSMMALGIITSIIIQGVIYAECRVFYIDMLSVIMLRMIVLSVIMLSSTILSIVMLSVYQASRGIVFLILCFHPVSVTVFEP
jgi:hypothetical protein